MRDAVDLGPLEAFIGELVSEGRFPSRDAAIRESVRLRKLAALDETLECGLADARAGRVRPVGGVFDRLEARYQTRIDRD